jgi:DsbC/DsbD-like thiol-disulfide interchange protein
MKYQTSLSAFFIIIFAALVGNNAFAQTVSGSLEENAVLKGAKVRGKIVLDLPEELHVNSNKPNSEYAIATSIRITAPGLKVGEVEYPEGKNKKFQFSETELNVYDGQTAFPFTVTVPRNFRGTSITVKALVRYQACTDEVCYPPKNKEIVLTAAVK